MRRMLLAAATAVTLAPGLAGAQEQVQTQGDVQCLRDLAALRQQMDQDGLWPSSDGARPDHGQGAQHAAPPIDPGRPEQPVTPDAVPTTRTDGPWAATQSRAAPVTEISSLSSAVQILASRGEREACATVMAALSDTYSEYVAELREAGSTSAK